MIVKPGFVAKEIGGQEVIIAVGKAAEKFNGYITLNGSGKLLWEALSKGATKEELISLMLATYDVERDIASRDVDAFLNKLILADVIDEEDSDMPAEEEDE